MTIHGKSVQAQKILTRYSTKIGGFGPVKKLAPATKLPTKLTAPGNLCDLKDKFWDFIQVTLP